MLEWDCRVILGSVMLKKLNTKSKIAIIVGLEFVILISLRIDLESYFYKNPNSKLIPLINAKGKAGQLIQAASQNKLP